MQNHFTAGKKKLFASLGSVSIVKNFNFGLEMLPLVCGLRQIVFVVKLPTSHKISQCKNNFGELNW